MPHPNPRLYLGYESLIRRFSLRVPPLMRIFVATEQTLERHTFTPDGSERIELPLRRLSDPEAYTGQLTFALKREHLNLTVLGALFEHQEARDGVQEWLHAMPSSRYSRMAGHLVEWLSEHKLDYDMPAGNPRIFLLDPVHHVCGPKVLDAKFGIINNVLGGRAYSPLVRRTPRLTALLEEGLAEKVKTAMSSIEPEMLARAVDYLYLSETRSTYNIENEIPDSHRAGRFRKLLESATLAFIDERDIALVLGETFADRNAAAAAQRAVTQPKSYDIADIEYWILKKVYPTGVIQPMEALQLAKAAGVKVYTVGVGAEQMVQQSIFGRQLINPSQDLDEVLLTRIAEETGGKYFRARDLAELAQIYKLLDQLEPIERDQISYRPQQSLLHWPLVAALFCSVLLALGQIRWSGRKKHVG